MKQPQFVSPDLTREKNHARSRAMAEAVISAFAATLKSEARKKGGFLTLPDIEDLDVAFQEKISELTKVFEHSFNDAAREQEDLKWQQIKRPAFDRLMVKRFADHFMVKDAEGVPHGTFSRRILPGFFLALNMLMGPDAMEEFHGRCDAIMARVMKGIVPVDWDLLDHNDDMNDVILDAQLAMLWQFSDSKKRADWFIKLVNANLAPAHEGAAQVEVYWELDHRSFLIMINGLLSDLKQVVHEPQAWKRLKRRHPDINQAEIFEILERLS